MNKKLMILTIVTVMVVLISLGGSQVLSGGRGFKPNYDTELTGHIQGGGLVEWSRGRFISSGASASDYGLEFSEEGTDDFWKANVGDNDEDFAGSHVGWLMMMVDRKSGRALFEYRWSDEMGNNYDLSGHGFFESSKKDGSFTFTSEGEYRLVQWYRDPPGPSEERWYGYPVFTILGTYLER